jgi:hypothetical protein
MKRAIQRIVAFLALGGLAICVFPGCSQEKQEKTDVFSPISEVSFDESMGKSESQFRLIFSNSDDAARYAKSKAIYEQNQPSKVARSQNPRIPKIIHQIWLGPRLPPAYFAEFQEKIKQLHPGWEYHLWSEADLEELNLENWDLVQKTQNYAEQSDIIRGDLLDRFGGVYMDVDLDVIHCLNELHEKYDFYAGMEHPHQIATTPNRVWVGISIMAAKPSHPIIRNWKRRVRSNWDEVNLRYSSPVERVINHTYFNFTHAVMQEIGQHPGNIDMLFPATYFYPIAPNFAAKRRSSFRAWREKFFDFLENIHLKKPRAFSRPYPETIAVHYWGNTWLPTMNSQVLELQRIVDAARKDMYKMKQKVRIMEKHLASSDEKISEMQLALHDSKNVRVAVSESTSTSNEDAVIASTSAN